MTREEHLAWAKQRALEYLDLAAPSPGRSGNLAAAVASFTSDLQKNEETQGMPFSERSRMLHSAAKGDVAAVRAWIESYIPPLWEGNPT